MSEGITRAAGDSSWLTIKQGNEKSIVRIADIVAILEYGRSGAAVLLRGGREIIASESLTRFIE